MTFVALYLWLTAAHAAPKAVKRQPFDVKEGKVAGHSDWNYWTVTPNLQKSRLVVARKPDGAGDYLQELVTKKALVAINGGYFEANFAPTSWLMDNKGEYRKPNKKSKRGGVLAVKAGKAFIGKYKDLPFEPEFALQNSPLLVDPDGKVGIISDDGRRAPRTTACLGSKGELHFIVLRPSLGMGPTLKETAEVLHDAFNCKVALNLDGGPSTGIWFSAALKKESSPPPVPIGYGIAVEKR